MKKLKFSVIPNLIDKIPPEDKRWMADGFISIEDSTDNLVQCIRDGWAFSYQFLDQKRKKENFIASDILVIDLDDHWCISDALKDPTNSKY